MAKNLETGPMPIVFGCMAAAVIAVVGGCSAGACLVSVFCLGGTQQFVECFCKGHQLMHAAATSYVGICETSTMVPLLNHGLDSSNWFGVVKLMLVCCQQSKNSDFRPNSGCCAQHNQVSTACWCHVKIMSSSSSNQSTCIGVCDRLHTTI